MTKTPFGLSQDLINSVKKVTERNEDIIENRRFRELGIEVPNEGFEEEITEDIGKIGLGIRNLVNPDFDSAVNVLVNKYHDAGKPYGDPQAIQSHLDTHTVRAIDDHMPHGRSARRREKGKDIYQRQPDPGEVRAVRRHAMSQLGVDPKGAISGDVPGAKTNAELFRKASVATMAHVRSRMADREHNNGDESPVTKHLDHQRKLHVNAYNASHDNDPVLDFEYRHDPSHHTGDLGNPFVPEKKAENPYNKKYNPKASSTNREKFRKDVDAAFQNAKTHIDQGGTIGENRTGLMRTLVGPTKDQKAAEKEETKATGLRPEDSMRAKLLGRETPSYRKIQRQELDKAARIRKLNNSRDDASEERKFRKGLTDIGALLKPKKDQKQELQKSLQRQELERGLERQRQKQKLNNSRDFEYATEDRVEGVIDGQLEDDGHLCATKIFSEEYGEGTPIHSAHADPDELGNIEWYDVMFEHGIERILTDEVTILSEMSHGSHNKKSKKKADESAGEIGTAELVNRYKADTPGEISEISTMKASNYMRASSNNTAGQDAKTQDKRIKGQSLADAKIRKAMGYSSKAKVAANPNVKPLISTTSKYEKLNNSRDYEYATEERTGLLRSLLGPDKAERAKEDSIKSDRSLRYKLKNKAYYRLGHPLAQPDAENHYVHALSNIDGYRHHPGKDDPNDGPASMHGVTQRRIINPNADNGRLHQNVINAFKEQGVNHDEDAWDLGNHVRVAAPSTNDNKMRESVVQWHEGEAARLANVAKDSSLSKMDKASEVNHFHHHEAMAKAHHIIGHLHNQIQHIQNTVTHSVHLGYIHKDSAALSQEMDKVMKAHNLHPSQGQLNDKDGNPTFGKFHMFIAPGVLKGPAPKKVTESVENDFNIEKHLNSSNALRSGYDRAMKATNKAHLRAAISGALGHPNHRDEMTALLLKPDEAGTRAALDKAQQYHDSQQDGPSKPRKFSFM